MSIKSNRRTPHRGRPRAAGALAERGLTMDYPADGAVIQGAEYIFRVSASSEAEAVEISIDQGPWRPCRWAAGYWWYDWEPEGAGRYQARARMRTADGLVDATPARYFRVNWGSLEG